MIFLLLKTQLTIFMKDFLNTTDKLFTNVKENMGMEYAKHIVRVSLLHDLMPMIKLLSLNKLDDTDRKFPLAHKYSTNPDLDSRVPYYASNTHLGLTCDKQSKYPNINVKFCISFKILWR